MARISGVNIPSAKRIEIALTYIYGIGNTRAKKICLSAKLDPNKRVNSLTEDELSKIRELIEKDYSVEGDLRRDNAVNLKRLVDYRFKTALVKNKNGMYYIMIVEKDKIDSFNKYLDEENNQIIQWLDKL